MPTNPATELAIELLSGREWDSLTEHARRILDTRVIEYNGVSAYYIEILPLIGYVLAETISCESLQDDPEFRNFPALIDFQQIADLLRDNATRLDTED